MRRTHSKYLLVLLSLGWLLALVPSLPGLTVTHGPDITPGETTATLQWTTDVEAGTRVLYGTQENLLDQRVTGSVGKDHRVNLSGLQPGTRYYFNIGSARALLGNGSFLTTGGKPASAEVSGTSSMGSTVKRFFSDLLSQKTADRPQSVQNTLTPAPPASQTWCHLDTLEDHYERHGADFRSTSSGHYAAQAWRFLQHARLSSLPMKWDDADRTLRVWEPKTRSFAAYDSRGKTRTYFRPSNPDYWNRQPGRPVKPDSLPFR